MECKNMIRVVVFGLAFSISGGSYSQPKNQAKPYYDEAHYLVCVCGNKIAATTGHSWCKNHKSDCLITKYAPCSNDKCGRVWWNHHLIFLGKDEFQLIPKVVKKKEISHHIAKKDSCFTVDSIPERGTSRYRYIIKAKYCDKTMWCTLKNEPGAVRDIRKGKPTSYVATPGEKKVVTVSHVQPAAGTVVKDE